MKLLSCSLVSLAFITLNFACSPTSKSNRIDSTDTPSIIGGTDVPEGAALQKSIVGIYDVKNAALCTGSLLENNIVLTAAHCIGENPQDHLIIFSADLNSIFKSRDKNLLLQKIRRGTKIVVNPHWGKKPKSDDDSWGDTALIKFEGKIPAGFVPATILASTAELTEGTTITVAGYGVNKDILTEVSKEDSPYFKEKEATGEVFCEQVQDDKSVKCFKEEMGGEGRLRTTELRVAGEYSDTEIAFDQTQGQASCEGDSGGPAYLKKANGEYHLFGVTSRGTRGCNAYVVYSNIASAKLNIWLNEAKALLQ